MREDALPNLIHQPASKAAIEAELSRGHDSRFNRDSAKHKEFMAQLDDVKARIAQRKEHLEKMEALRAARAAKEVEEQRKCADELHVPNDRQFGDSDYKVYVNDGDIWDAQLTCVDLGYNIFGKVSLLLRRIQTRQHIQNLPTQNKYYNIQLLVNWRALEGDKPAEPFQQPHATNKARIPGRLARKQAREAAQRQLEDLETLRKPMYQVFNRWGRMGGQSYGGYSYGGYGSHEHGGSKKEAFDGLCSLFLRKRREFELTPFFC